MFNPEKYRLNTPISADETILQNASDRLRANVESPVPDYLALTQEITLFDEMDRATKPASLDTWRKIGRSPDMAGALELSLINNVTADQNEEVLRLVRVGHLLGYTGEFPRLQKLVNNLSSTHPFVAGLIGRVAGVLHQQTPHDYYAQGAEFDRVFDEHKRRLEAKRTARGTTRGATGGRARSTTTGWGAEDISGKSPEWVEAWNEVDLKWQAAGLPTERTVPATNTRFDRGMEFLHDDIAAHMTIQVGREGLRIRAMTEYLIPRIWTEPGLVEPFFKRATSGRSAPERAAKEEQLARRIFLPGGIRDLPKLTTPNQIALVKKIHSSLAFALHPDRKTSVPDIDLNLVDYVDIFYKQVNATWGKADALTRP